MLSAQKENPVKKNFYQSVNLYLKEFGISSTEEEIRSMKPMPFKKIVKEKYKEAAFQYLSDKQIAGKKEKYIKYFSLHKVITCLSVFPFKRGKYSTKVLKSVGECLTSSNIIIYN